MNFSSVAAAEDKPELLAFVYLHRTDQNEWHSRDLVLTNPERLSMATTSRVLKELCLGKIHFLPSQVDIHDLQPGQPHEFFALDIVPDHWSAPESSISLADMLERFKAAHADGWQVQAPAEQTAAGGRERVAPEFSRPR